MHETHLPQQRPTARETLLLGFGDGENPPGDDEDWRLPLTDDEVTTDPGNPPATVLPATTSRPWISWVCLGLLTCAVFLASHVAGLKFLFATSPPPALVREAVRAADVDTPATAVEIPADLPPVTQIVVIDEQREAPRIDEAPAAPPPIPLPIIVNGSAPAGAAAPKPRAVLYDRVRQVVLENKTEETQRLGMGDVAFRHVPDDGSILVGMEVTYVPHFTHYVVKSVRPIYQGPDGNRYDGPVCGSPQRVGERIEAKEGYAIGGAAIASGMGIDAMQLTFMEIGPTGLNAHKSYLSKWLGGYGGPNATTFLNDGRPIVGIAGMRSNWTFGPAFCLCFVTTRPGAIEELPTAIRKAPPRQRQ